MVKEKYCQAKLFLPIHKSRADKLIKQNRADTG
jgi:hypothetical protein